MRVGIPVCDQSFRFSQKKRQATSDETGQFRVARISVIDTQLDKRHAAVNGSRLRYEWAYARPRTIRPDDQIESFADTAPEHKLVGCIVLGMDGAQFVAPPNDMRR